MPTLNVVSYGGGRNSKAVLCGLHERRERPDLILLSDTGGEKPETYADIAETQDWLSRVGFPAIEIVRESITLEDDCLDRETLPGKAFGFGSCSERFKIRPQKRYVKQFRPCAIRWIVGIHAGEAHRRWTGACEGEDAVWYPLLDWGWGQAECEAAIRRQGLTVPVKSACFFCPSMKKHEVLQLSVEHPELMERALEMERAANESGNLSTVKGLGRRWSWAALLAADQSQRRLFSDDQSPLCDMCVT